VSIWNFEHPTPESVTQVFAALLDRAPAPEELSFFLHPDQTGVGEPDEWYPRSIVWSEPWRPNWPTLGLYTACHGRQLLRYWKELYPNPPEMNCWGIVSWKFPERIPTLLAQPLVHAFFQHTDFYVSNAWPAHQPFLEQFGSQVAAEIPGRRLRMHAPSLSSIFPVTDIPKDLENVRRLLRAGQTHDQIARALREGQFDPQFTTRHAEAMNRMAQKDAQCDTPIEPFVRAHLRREKLFWLISHPTMLLISRIGADLFTQIFQRPAISDEDLFALPWRSFQFGFTWPETHYEWDFFKFNYPRRWEDNALPFYESLIRKIVV
jgi:hypothetical protein